MSWPRLQFGFRTLWAGMIVLAICLALVRREVVGREELESGPIFSTHTPSVSLRFQDSDHARLAQSHFQQSSILINARRYLANNGEGQQLAALDCSLTTTCDKNNLIVRYDAPKYGRMHFDLQRCAYVFDVHDPDAARRNQLREDAVKRGIDQWAQTLDTGPLAINEH